MIKKFIRGLLYKEKATNDKYIRFLRKKGVKIGEGVRFYSLSSNYIDVTEPILLSIGNHVSVTHGVIILTHDASWAVLKNHPDYSGSIYGSQAKVSIGNNVFIGMNAIITSGVTIGDNVIIGAGSVVTRDCESNSVYAGNPAKRIMSIDEFAKKRQKKQFEEAKELALRYVEVKGANPPQTLFFEYFMLFSTLEDALAIPEFSSQLKTFQSFDESVAYMQMHKPMFESYEKFLAACLSCDDL